MEQSFAGDKKKGQSILGPIEKRFINYWTPKIPLWITSPFLTLATIPISIFIIAFSFLAQGNIHWLWGVSFMIFLQWLTDSFDGAIGRHRNSGLARWGYYMDHFLDYIFLCSILIGYAILLPDNFKYLLFFILALFGAFMVNAYLRFAATNEFQIAYLGIGPTEVRIIFIIVNTLLIFFGKTYVAWALPYVLVFSLLGLCVAVYHNSRYIWEMDMKENERLED
ncbi:MAG: CDP-alcohol phosphatidyltransferase family protein [Patescibacteria group bacterium]